MPIRLSALTADRRPLKIEFGDDTLNLVYRPSTINAVQEARELEDKAAGKHVMAQARTLVEAIISWDIQDDDGQSLPVSEEVMASLGLDVTLKINRAIIQDLLPNQTTGSVSSNGASAPSSPPRPSGT